MIDITFFSQELVSIEYLCFKFVETFFGTFFGVVFKINTYLIIYCGEQM